MTEIRKCANCDRPAMKGMAVCSSRHCKPPNPDILARQDVTASDRRQSGYQIALQILRQEQRRTANVTARLPFLSVEQTAQVVKKEKP